MAWFRFSFCLWADGFSAETPLLGGLSRRYNSIKTVSVSGMVAQLLINYVMPQHLISYRPGRDSASDFTTVDARSEHAFSRAEGTKQTMIRNRFVLDSIDLFRRRLANVKMGRERNGGHKSMDTLEKEAKN
ncbi:hypothetical protein FOXG_20455 [Fusarium oxysporum f. sp. lycopersici 4287]|uniref:Uncharacterized protein n=1 Tax=Fusarium oxysporum f. sp. lycopersici (strain 4287 / CBS 123668 / FGSC 9935 / NRRL 34936) TaxID=426428 RepID=A0A0J9VJP8_FUSO4|nr:hypothetical protein FOXG_20455 [Fusarium oxysporum f. sp. lycopersici 4287]KAJ9429566.1 hypothetical protein QL093DRAFT_2165926 [Fusarium oxysporum]KNB11060.1 hypothetical protein FOXG_20455 [Fusarium oxysporum f. sp. lycopersici 4287]